GQCDQIFINTSGIGECIDEAENIVKGQNIKAGDKLILNGTIGDHGMAVMSERNQLNIKATIASDCACLNGLTALALQTGGIRFMRDATRGGLGTVLAELAAKRNFGIDLDETKIPVRENVRGMCELL
ncbi:AIR synthase-related protein, partial [Arthrospira platensis SPKY1]|nr:AIR synthase-related protein [Arthrospira platensis SPKY1]